MTFESVSLGGGHLEAQITRVDLHKPKMLVIQFHELSL